MNDKARAGRNEYMRLYMKDYRAKNKEKLSEYQRAWRKAHPDSVKLYNQQYWENKSKGDK